MAQHWRAPQCDKLCDARSCAFGHPQCWQPTARDQLHQCYLRALCTRFESIVHSRKHKWSSHHAERHFTILGSEIEEGWRLTGMSVQDLRLHSSYQPLPNGHLTGSRKSYLYDKWRLVTQLMWYSTSELWRRPGANALRWEMRLYRQIQNYSMSSLQQHSYMSPQQSTFFHRSHDRRRVQQRSLWGPQMNACCCFACLRKIGPLHCSKYHLHCSQGPNRSDLRHQSKHHLRRVWQLRFSERHMAQEWHGSVG